MSIEARERLAAGGKMPWESKLLIGKGPDARR
jgi:hypothetical protein